METAERTGKRTGLADLADLGGVAGRLARASLGGAGLTFIEGADDHRALSYRDLLGAALRTLASLQARGMARGDPVIVQLEDNRANLVAIWACLLGGLIPAPLHAGRAPEHLRKLRNVWQELDRPWVIADDARLDGMRRFWTECGDGAAALERRVWLADAPTAAAAPARPASPSDGETALLQFSSGSTGVPKGVMLSHGNLIADTAAIAERRALTPADRLLSWVPLSHDLGLIGVHMTAALHGIPCAIMPTTLFVRRPPLWLDKADELGASVLYGTNFSLDYLLAGLADRMEGAGWDLSRVRAVILGAEPIEPATCRRFAAALAPFGLAPDTLAPCYGLAEGTIAVSVPAPGTGVVSHRLDPGSLAVGRPVAPAGSAGHAVELAACGHAVTGCRIELRDAEGRALPERHLGHVFIAGATVSRGYWGHAPAAGDGAEGRNGGWLDTGDLGFLDAGALVIAGRAKDLIIIDGLNVHPTDLERIIQDGLDLGPGSVVVAGVVPPEGGPERIAVFVRSKADDDAFRALGQRIRRAVAREAGLAVGHVLRVRKIPRTSSGKPQRFELVRAFQAGTLRDGLADIGAPALRTGDPLERVRTLAETLCGPLDADRDLGGQGVSSLVAVELAAQLSRAFGVVLPLDRVFALRTLRALAGHLAARAAAASRPAGPSALVRLSGEEDTGEPPLILVHPGSGAVTPYLTLARRLAGAVPVSGLPAPGLRPGETVLRSVEALADHHAAALRAGRPAGPHRLGGWSFGGLVALEIARRLRAEGAAVAPVLLLDAYLPGRRVPTGGLPDDPDAVDEAVTAALLDRALARHRAPAMDELAVTGPGLEDRLAEARARNLLLSIFDSAVDGAAAVRLVRCYSAALGAARRYRPQPYDGPVALIRPRGGPSHRDPTLGWWRIAHGGLTLLWCDGDHETLVRDEHAGSMAAAVRQALGLAP